MTGGQWNAVLSDDGTETPVVAWIPDHVDLPTLELIACESDRDARIVASVLNDIGATPFKPWRVA